MMPNVIPIGAGRKGAMPEDWGTYTLLLGLTRDLLPVVSNPHATISPASNIKSVGKVPSIYNKDRQVVGIAAWTQRETPLAAIDKWSREPDYGICIQTREVRALDIDIEDPEQSVIVEDTIQGHLNWLGLPRRSRSNSGKSLLAFRLPGDFGKRRIKTAHGVIEFLATGQQFVAAGTHPSGVKYEWTWPDDCNDFPTLTADEFEALWQALQDEFGIEEAVASTTSSKATVLTDAIAADPLAQHLVEQGLVLKQERDGRLHITCPWEHEHTTDTGVASTTYWPAHTGGYDRGHFKCLHAHCEGRTDAQFIEAVGYTPPSLIDGFENLEGAAEQPTTPKAERFHVHTAEELCAMPLPGYWIKHVLPKAGLAVVYGEPASGKSFLALDMVMAIARGEAWRGKRVHQGRVVYVAAEGQGAFGKRVRAYTEQHNLTLTDVPIGFVTDPPNLQERESTGALWQQVKAFGRPDVIVIDTLAQSMPGGDENSSEGMGKVLMHCREMHRMSGALIVLIHHAGKDITRGARGWSGLKAAADAEIEITRDGDVRTARLSKMKDDEDGGLFHFTLPQVVVGVDEDDEPITSCYCEAVEAPEKTAKAYKPSGQWEVAILDALKVIGEAQTVGIEVDGVVAEARSRILPGQGRDRRDECLRRAITGLGRKGVFALDAENCTIDLGKVDE